MVTSPFVLSFTCCANLCASTARKSPSPSLAPGHWWDRRSVTAPAPPPLSASPQALSKPTNKTAPIAHKNRRLSVVIFPFPRSLAAVIEIPSATRPPTLLRQTRQGISSLAASLTQYPPLLLFGSFPRTVVDRPSNVTKYLQVNIESPRLPADADRAIRPASIQLPSRRIGVASGNL